MAIQLLLGTSDAVTEAIMAALRTYEHDHPRAQIDLYRYSPASVRGRVIDPDFAGQGKPQRNQTVWRYLGQLSEEEQGDISTLLLLTPDETSMSVANSVFNDPAPSRLNGSLSQTGL